MATVFVNGKQQDHVREGLVRVITGSIEFPSNGDADMIKITDEVKEAVRQTGLTDGTVTLFVPGATGALTTLEYEPGVVEDVQRALDVVAPADRFYQHNVNLGDGNGHSHVRAGLVGPSLVVPVRRRPPHARHLPEHRLLRLRRAPARAQHRGAGDGRMTAADAAGRRRRRRTATRAGSARSSRSRSTSSTCRARSRSRARPSPAAPTGSRPARR